MQLGKVDILTENWIGSNQHYMHLAQTKSDIKIVKINPRGHMKEHLKLYELKEFFKKYFKLEVV